jgi:hypothetical protein
LNQRSYEVQLEDQRKAQEGHIEEGKIAKPTNGKKSDKPKEKAKKSSNSKLPLHSQYKLSPLGRIYYVFSLNHPVSKRVIPTLCTFSPSLAMNSSNTNREKHEMICMRSKLGCFTDYINKYFSNYTQQDAKTLQK